MALQPNAEVIFINTFQLQLACLECQKSRFTRVGLGVKISLQQTVISFIMNQAERVIVT